MARQGESLPLLRITLTCLCSVPHADGDSWQRVSLTRCLFCGKTPCRRTSRRTSLLIAFSTLDARRRRGFRPELLRTTRSRPNQGEWSVRQRRALARRRCSPKPSAAVRPLVRTRVRGDFGGKNCQPKIKFPKISCVLRNSLFIASRPKNYITLARSGGCAATAR